MWVQAVGVTGEGAGSEGWGGGEGDGGVIN